MLDRQLAASRRNEAKIGPTGGPLSMGAISKLRTGCPILKENNLGTNVKQNTKLTKLLNLYNTKVGSLSEIVKTYRIATKKISEINEDIEDANTAQAKFNKFAQNVLSEFAKYKVEKANLQNAIQNVKNQISESEKDIKDRKIKKDISKLENNLSKLEIHLSKIKDQSKAIKQSFSAKYGILPMYTLNNALYHKKNNGGIIGILKQVHDFIVSNKYDKTLIKTLSQMLDKKFEYELKKIESVANFKQQGNPNLQLDENMEIKIDNAYTALNTLISQIKKETDNTLQVLQEKTSLEQIVKSAQEFTVENEIKSFIEGKYYENTPKTFAKSMQEFCKLAYLNAVSKELLPDLLSDIKT